MSWSSTSCPCCASRRESRHRSWSLSWSRTSAKIKNQFRCHHCHQLSSSMLESQLKIKIRCHKCHWLSSSKLQLHICQILASLFQLEKGWKEGNLLAITRGRNLYGCEYVGHYGQKILSITYLLFVEDCPLTTLVSKSPNAMVSPLAQTALYEYSPTCNRPMQMPPRNDDMHFCPSWWTFEKM